MRIYTKIYNFAPSKDNAMSVYTTKEKLWEFFSSQNRDTYTTGLVPTMGALHEGHISLLRKAISENDFVIVSIFVNPTQFNNKEDLEKYPRTLDSDVQKIKECNKNVIVYAPATQDVYDNNIAAKHFDFEGLDTQMEGKHRPGHFDGVGTIVKKLFEITRPDNAYFGEKDFQQLQIIKKMTVLEKMAVHIVPCPILRESNGLAMSSRNERLKPDTRANAGIIFEVLSKAKNMFRTENIVSIKDWVTNQFKNNDTFALEYIEITDEDSLEPSTEKLNNKKYRAFIAVYADGVRLIDNVALN